MKILITGSSGMIGSELAPMLVEAGHEVHGLDRKEPEFTPLANFIQHDLLEPVRLDQSFDLIIHLAANARVWELVENPDLALENVITTHNIFEFARKAGIKKILFASSREVYGNGNSLPVNESVGSQRKSESSYAASKLFGEAYAWAYTNCYNLDVKIVRFSNVYGKYDYSDRFVPKVIGLLKDNQPVEIWGEGKVLDFTYITDAAQGILHLIKSWDQLEDREWNIAFGRGYSLISVAQALKAEMGSKSEIKILDSHPGEVMEYTADISRITATGWTPKVDLAEGLKRAVEYYGRSQE
jgi:nucleoside-diphosphate-sugar epimerase